ncbi:hypothetical protein SEA_LYELL_7 [Microbacterium phage Lyell]|nr:hypothetical protein SEA_LYELL_122 [Microbacterium phage Lyell]AXC36225.1 hypothetical protein SEA_LYELL_7 [Microbacterium phage Lyell]
MTITVEHALSASLTLDADNSGHADIVDRIMERSAMRGDIAIVDGSLSPAPDTHKAVARVMLGTMEVDFVGLTGNHSRWTRA